MLSYSKKLSLFFYGSMIAIMIFYHLATAATVAETFNLSINRVLFHGAGLSGTIVMSAIILIFIGAIIFTLITEEKHDVV